MGCSIQKIKDDSLAEVRKIVKGNAMVTSYTKGGDVIITPSNKSDKVNTMAKAINMANQKVEAINKWSKETFNTDAYTGQWASIYRSPSDVRVEIKFPKGLEAEYNRKIAEEEAREIQRADAERAGIMPDDYEDDYQFDYLPPSSDGYNFGTYLDIKQRMRNYFNQRIKVLEEMSNQTKAHLEQIESFKEVSRRLSIDIKHLDTEQAVVDNMFKYFDNDLNIIKEILLENPTLDNLLSARNYVDMMKFVYEYDPDSGKRDMADKTAFSDNNYKDAEDGIVSLFNKFQNDLNDIDRDLEIAEMELTTKIINSNDKDNPQREAAEELSKQIKDVPHVAAFLLPIDGDTKNNPLLKVVREIFDSATGKEETFNLRQKIHNQKPKLEKRLKELGFSNSSGILGSLFSSVNYDIFKRNTEDGNHRLIGKFSDKWLDFQKEITTNFLAIENLLYKKDKDIQDYTNIKNAKSELFNKLNENVTFLDVRRTPELLNNPELQSNFGAFFGSQAEADAHKEEIIQSMISESGNRKSAERIYNKLVDEQLKKIYSFEISMEQYKERLLKKNGANDITELPEKDRNNFLNKYYTESPFAFAEAYQTTGLSEVTKVYYDNGERKTSTDIASMEYVSYVPKRRDQFDDTFEKQIETDSTLYDAWENFDDSLTYINKNRKYQRDDNSQNLDDSLPQEYKTFVDHKDSFRSLSKYIGKSTLDRFKEVVSTTKFRDTDKSLRITGGITSIDEAINISSRPMKAVLAAQGISLREIYSASNLPEPVYDMLHKALGYDLPNAFVMGDLVREIHENKVLKNQKLDLSDTLASQLETVEMFKAKKEIETMLLFFKNQITSVKNNTDADKKKRAINIVTSFVNKHLYDVNNRANWVADKKGEKHFGKLFNTHEKEMVTEIDNSINLLKDMLPSLTDKDLEKAISDIASLEAIRDSKGRVVTTGSVFETLAIRLNILVGLGMNLPSQLKNYAIGNLAGRQNDGLTWTSGNFVKASSYTRKWKILGRKLSKKATNNYKLTNTLIDGLGVFQNSANELDRIAEYGYVNGVGKYIKNPLHIVGEVEKTIQRPQILAMLGDVEITDVDGNIAPAFNANDTNNPHPAFELDDSGNLTLKEQFNTPENRDTWINRNSQQYADLFGESGLVPSTIAKINGDYRSTSTTMIKDTSLGSLFMMFKTWLPAYILRRYGKKDGVISKLAESGRATEALNVTTMTATMYGIIGASVLGSPLLAIGATAAYLGAKKYKMMVAQEKNNALGILKEIQKSLFSLQFGTSIVRNSGAVAAKFLQQNSDMLFGKRLISDDVISNISGLKQGEEESDLDFAKNKARLQFLLTEASTTLSLLLMKLLVNALLYPDDEEKEKFNEAGDPIERIMTSPSVTMYMATENLLSGLASDVNLLNDPVSAGKNILAGSNADLYQKMERFAGSFGDQWRDGDYKSGPNEGKNRISTNLGKLVIPKGYTDYLLGFGNISQRDYNPKDLINLRYRSDFKVAEEERQNQRRERKEELTEQYTKNYPYKTKKQVDKKVLKKLLKEFPTVKKYFNPDGTVKPHKKYKVEKYLNE